VNGTSKMESQRTNIWNLWDKCENIVHDPQMHNILKSVGQMWKYCAFVDHVFHFEEFTEWDNIWIKCTCRVGRSKGTLQQSESHKNLLVAQRDHQTISRYEFYLYLLFEVEGAVG